MSLTDFALNWQGDEFVRSYLFMWHLSINLLPFSINELIKTNVSRINQPDKFGTYLLYWAIVCRQIDYAKALINLQGINLKVLMTADSRQALHIVTSLDNLDLFRAIIAKDSTIINERDGSGQTVLMIAAGDGAVSIATGILQSKHYHKQMLHDKGGPFIKRPMLESFIRIGPFGYAVQKPSS